MTPLRWSALVPLVFAMAPAARAAEFNFDIFGGTDVQWQNQISIGVQVRTNNPNPALIGKAHLAQNRNLCAKDDCLSFNPNDNTPNERYLAAPGAMGSFTDQG